MDKYIKEDEVIKTLEELQDAHEHEMLKWAIRTVKRNAIKSIKEIPTADVRPVVLCRDCKHKGWVQEPEHGKSVDYCRLIERCVDKQFFCAAGERKTNCGAEMLPT